MFSKQYANLQIKHILHGTSVPGLSDNAAAGALTKLVLALHTDDPGPNGTQETNEVVYTGYERREVDRSAALWTVVDNIARPTARLEFLEMTAGAEQLAKWITIGVAKLGGGMYLLRGRLAPDIQCRLGVIPAIKADTEIEFVIDTPAGL